MANISPWQVKMGSSASGRKKSESKSKMKKKLLTWNRQGGSGGQGPVCQGDEEEIAGSKGLRG
jgi:hypothetical protein